MPSIPLQHPPSSPTHPTARALGRASKAPGLQSTPMAATHRCTRLIVLPARYAGVRAVRCGPLSGNPCGGQKYLVVASNCSSAPRELEVGAAQLHEDARRSSRSFVSVLPSSVSALPSHSPKSSKLTEVCVPTPQPLCCAPPSSGCAWCLADIPNARSEHVAAHAQALRSPSRSLACPSRSFRILWAIWRQNAQNKANHTDLITWFPNS